MPLHNHILSFPEDPPNDLARDQYTSLHASMTATETDPLLPQQKSHHAESETRTLTYACILTTVFFFIEFFGGYIAGSLAIMSDAAHLLSDLAGFAISLLAVAVSRFPPNAQMTFGFARAEVLGAFVSILFIWVLTAVLIVFAVERLFNPSPVDGPIMLALGVIGLLVNIVLGIVLGGHGHSHGHGHDHAHHHAGHAHDEDGLAHNHDGHTHDHDDHAHNDDTGAHSHLEHDPEAGVDRDDSDHGQHSHGHDNGHEEGSREDIPFWKSLVFGSDRKSVNMRAAYLHVLGDALQNIGVIFAAIIMTFYPGLSFIDPLCTLLFAGIVIVTTKGLAKETLTVLMEGTPPSVKLDDIHAALIAIDGVASVGDLHAWSITPRRLALSVHLYQKAEYRGHDVIKDAQKVLAKRFGIFHATVQVNCDTTACCDDGLYFEAESNEKNCISYNNKGANSGN